MKDFNRVLAAVSHFVTTHAGKHPEPVTNCYGDVTYFNRTILTSPAAVDCDKLVNKVYKERVIWEIPAAPAIPTRLAQNGTCSFFVEADEDTGIGSEDVAAIISASIDYFTLLGRVGASSTIQDCMPRNTTVRWVIT